MSGVFKKRFTITRVKRKMYNFLSFDIETITQDKKNIGKFLFGGIYNGTDYLFFTIREKMRDYITRAYFIRSIWVAHNLEYDLNRIFLDDPIIERFYNGGRLVMARYEKSKGNFIYFWDSYNLSLQSLANLGKVIGIEKGEIEFTDEITQKFIDYNKRDCEIVWKYITYLQDLVYSIGGNMKATLGGISLDLYRRKYMPKEAEYFQLPHYLIDIYRQGYYGGRVEVFDFNSYKKVFYYDIISSYPSSMLNKFPLLDSWVNKPDLDYDGISFVQVIIPELFFSPLPYRTESGKLLFPCGQWSGWYYNNELRGIKKIYPQVKIEIKRGVHYKKSMPIFSNFVNTIYEKRKKSKTETENFIYKIFLNSLYGKFAVRSNFDIIKNKEVTHIRSNIVSSNVIWSGMITSFSRITLLKLLIKSQSIYTDTDSSVSLLKLPCGNSLGDISVKDIYHNFRAVNNKHYEFNGTEKIKGIPKNAVKLSDNKYQYSIPIKYHSAQRRKIPLWRWVDVIKELSPDYDKRIILNNKLTKPFRIYNNKIMKDY